MSKSSALKEESQCRLQNFPAVRCEVDNPCNKPKSWNSILDAAAGGLADGVADPGSVFLYRREPREVAEKLGADVSKFEGDIVPVIFSVSFRDPGGYFLATKVQMRHQDVLFVANAASVEVTKFLQFLNVIMQTTSNGILLREDIKTTKGR